jgi:hypothetical protein
MHHASNFDVYFPLSDVAYILVESAQIFGRLVRPFFMQLSLNIDRWVTAGLFSTLLALTVVRSGTF